MSTVASVKAEINSLISSANAKTGESDTTLHNAVSTLIDGYGWAEAVGFITNGGTDWSYSFAYKKNMTAIPQAILDKNFRPTKLYYAFYECNNLTTAGMNGFRVNDLAGSFNYAFYNCKKLTSVSLTDLQNKTTPNFSYAFYGCSELVSVDFGTYDVLPSNVTNMFYGCSKLRTITGRISFASITSSISNMFTNCSALEDVIFKEKTIGVTFNLQNCSSLSSASIASLISALKTVTTTKTLTLNATVKNNLTTEQRSTITGKGWTIA